MGAVNRIQKFSKEFSRFFVYFVGFNALVLLIALAIRSPVLIKLKGSKGLDYVTQASGLSILDTTNYAILRYRAFPYISTIDLDLKMNEKDFLTWMKKAERDVQAINMRLIVWSLDDEKLFVTNGLGHVSKGENQNSEQLRIIFDSDSNRCYYRGKKVNR